MKLYTYRVTLCHDMGKVNIRILARNKKEAINWICLHESCPKRAIIKIVRL